MRQINCALAVISVGLGFPGCGLALPDGWGLVAAGGVKSPLVTSEADKDNLSSELIFIGTRDWDLPGQWTLQALGVAQFERETAGRSFNVTDSATLGLVVRYRMVCCGTVSSGVRYGYEKQIPTGLETTGVQLGLDHVVYKKIAGEWSAPRVVSGWSNIRFPGSKGGDVEDWVAQGRYEISQGFEIRPLSAAPSLYFGLGSTLDKEGLSYNNKFVADIGGRLSWKLGKTAVSFDIRMLRDRRFLSDELYIGRQIRLGFRRVF
ncbi:MAG: hypothetical protein AAF198_04125 [Pseudomonadota bacterium]